MNNLQPHAGNLNPSQFLTPGLVAVVPLQPPGRNSLVDDTRDEFISAAEYAVPGAAAPIWRSVAAVLDWQHHGEDFEASGFKSRDVVLVFDFDAPQLTITPLIARNDAVLREALPQTGGLTWQRLPSLPANASGPLGEFVSRHRHKRTRFALLAVGRPASLPAHSLRNWLDDLAVELEIAGAVTFEGLGATAVSPAAGARVFQDLQDRGLPTWHVQRPAIYADIKRRGAYSELRFANHVRIAPGPGTQEFEVSHTFVLPRGHDSYTFPLAVSAQRHLLPYELHLESPAFPLPRTLEVKVVFVHRWGEEESESYYIEHADLGRVKASMIPCTRGGGIDMSPGYRAPAPPPLDTERDLARFEESGPEVVRLCRHVFSKNAKRGRRKKLEGQIATLSATIVRLGEAAAREDARAHQALMHIRGSLLMCWLAGLSRHQRSGLRSQAQRRKTVELFRHANIALAGMGRLAPRRVHDQITPSKLRQRPVNLRAATLEALRSMLYIYPRSEHLEALTALLSDRDFPHDDPDLYSCVVSTLCDLAWAREDFIFVLAAEVPSAPEVILSAIDRRLADFVEDVHNGKKKTWVKSYQDHAELLLALLRLRETGHPLLASNTARLCQLARRVRHLDGPARNIANSHSPRVRLAAAERPASVKYASKLGWGLDAFLRGTEDSRSVMVKWVRLDF